MSYYLILDFIWIFVKLKVKFVTFLAIAYQTIPVRRSDGFPLYDICRSSSIVWRHMIHLIAGHIWFTSFWIGHFIIRPGQDTKVYSESYTIFTLINESLSSFPRCQILPNIVKTTPGVNCAEDCNPQSIPVDIWGYWVSIGRFFLVLDVTVSV